MVLRYKTDKGTRHSTVDRSISELDKVLMSGRGSAATSFVSVGEYGSGKVKSFSGDDRVNDPDFRKIFNVVARKVNREFALQAGVVVWDEAVLMEESRAAAAARETEDIRVQQQVMEEDPEAFGGSSVLDPGSKMLGSTLSASEAAGGAIADGTACQEVEQLKEALAAKTSYALELLNAKTAAEEALAAKTSFALELLDAKTAAEEALAAETTALKDHRRAKVTAEVALAKQRLRAEKAETELKEAIFVRDNVLVSKVEADVDLMAAKTALVQHADKIKAELKKKDDLIASLRAACKQVMPKGGSKDSEARASALQERVGVLEQEYAELKGQLEAERRKVQEALAAQPEEGPAGSSSSSTTTKERSRLSRAVADKEEAIAQRDRVLLAKLGVEQELKEARATNADFPRVLGEAIKKKHEQYEGEGMAQVRAEVGKYKVEAEKRHQKEVDKLRQGMLDDARMHIDPLKLKVYTSEIENKKQLEDIKKLRAARAPLLRDLDDMRRKLILMQRRKAECRGFAGEDEAIVDPVEDEEALLTVTEKLRAELKYTEIRLATAGDVLRSTEQTVYSERERWAGEKKGLQAQLEAKDRESKELVATAMSDAVVRERWGMLPKFAEVQTEYDRRAAEVEKRLEAQAEAHRGRVQELHAESVKAETRWRQTVERMEEEREDLEEEVAMLELRAAAGGGFGEASAPPLEAVEQVSKAEHDRLLASEKSKADQAAHYSAEAVRLLEAEQAKVRELLGRLEIGAETAAGQAIEAEKGRAECARKAASEQTQRAARMEAEAKDAKQELSKRMEAGRAMLGEVYRSYEEVLKDNRQVRVRLAKSERLRQEAGLRVESALGAEKRAREALEEAVKRAATTTAGGDADDQAQAIRAAELCLHAEQALRHDAEAKVARCMLQRRADQARLVQLKSELREADARAEEMSSQMRGGPFAGF